MAGVSRIAIVAGHGGSNRGTRVLGRDESNWVLDYARLLHRRCEAMWRDPLFQLTRDGDYDLGLDGTAKKAADFGAQLAIVLHVNAYSTSALHGGAAFALDGDACGRSCGNEVMHSYPWELAPMRELAWYVPSDAHDWRKAVANVLRPYARRGISATLIELFYATHPYDVAVAACEGVIDRTQLAVMAGLATVLWPARTASVVA
ncbi:MAG: hypothetical protein GWN29_04855 [Gammaproteobacteria bacterium]|nr:N-acetylmuramoyl-L-alanine amidase [Gammaproteobacteria bacterium]NIV51084.1 hypothetical protein [Gammaproteobacteria bacterium]NIW23935.1 hypothetical protein [Gammaproteobacteria bacterium]NIX85027.1 hypothetical protein [Gammaproteobacteria bacterium]